MTALLPDTNVDKHGAYLAARMRAPTWREFWDYLQIRLVTFAEAGLQREDSDAVVWQRCQDQQLILLTSNRNDDGPDSLEATIRSRNTPLSLPVFTFGDADRILQSAAYAEQVMVSLFDQLLRLDALRGTGRLYLP